MSWTNRADFAVFILTHGRAERVRTVNMLREGGYGGRIVIMIDNEDEQVAAYRKRYGNDVVVFDKAAAAQRTDVGDNLRRRNVVVFARNEVYAVAREMGYRYIVVLDDDYSRVQLRYTDENFSVLRGKKTESLVAFMEISFEFLHNTGAWAVAWAQTGDSIGGIGNVTKRGLIRNKVMNFYFFDTEKPLPFYGRLNEDLTASVMAWKEGRPIFTIRPLEVSQETTQQNKGGLTDSYLENGTYVKSFYSVMWRPDCVRVSCLNTKNPRIHHAVNWGLACPKIVSERIKK